MIGHKLLQGESVRVTCSVGAACLRRQASHKGRGLQCRSFGHQTRALPGMDLGRREHVKPGVWMHVIVPRVELAEIVFSLSQGRKVTGEGGLGFDGGEVGLDVGVVVGRARPACRQAGWLNSCRMPSLRK